MRSILVVVNSGPLSILFPINIKIDFGESTQTAQSSASSVLCVLNARCLAARPQCGTSLDTCYQLRDSHPGVRCMDTVGSHICIEPGSRIVIPLNDTGCTYLYGFVKLKPGCMYLAWLYVSVLAVCT